MIRPTLIAVLIALPLTVAAQPPSKELAIFPAVFDGPYGEASAGQVFNATFEALGIRLDVEPLSYESMFLTGATSHVTAAARCGSDQACIVRVLEEAGATLGLRTIVNFALDPPLLTLELISTDPSIRGHQAVHDTGGIAWQQSLTVAVRALVDKQGLSPAGRLRVRADPSATISLPDSPTAIREGRDRFRAAPGQHRVWVVAPDGREASVHALVTAHRSTEVAVELPPLVASAPPEGSILTSGWFWTGVGVAAVGAASTALVLSHALDGPGPPACLCVTTVDHPCGTCP